MRCGRGHTLKFSNLLQVFLELYAVYKCSMSTCSSPSTENRLSRCAVKPPKERAHISYILSSFRIACPRNLFQRTSSCLGFLDVVASWPWIETPESAFSRSSWPFWTIKKLVQASLTRMPRPVTLVSTMEPKWDLAQEDQEPKDLVRAYGRWLVWSVSLTVIDFIPVTYHKHNTEDGEVSKCIWI